MKRLAVLLLVALLLLLVALALPLPVPGSMGGMALCPQCSPGNLHAGLALCLAILALFALVLPRPGTTRVASVPGSGRAGLDSPPEHPPRPR
ncbi:MAG: hypothetical protein HY658_02980 [Actinobacteria bacterium]|nr:hypothetical protein [Actinomycetota bacterium]